jgi:flagellar basal body-associated protein FliL
MLELIWIAIAVHVVVAVFVAGGIIAWRARADAERNNTEGEP